MYLMTLIIHLEIVKMVNFMLYIFYHNFFLKKKSWNKQTTTKRCEMHDLSSSWQTQDTSLPARKLCCCGSQCFLLPRKFSQGSLSYCVLTLRTYWIRVICRILSVIKLSLSWMFTEALFSQLSKYSSNRKSDRWIVLAPKCIFTSELRQVWQFLPLSPSFE